MKTEHFYINLTTDEQNRVFESLVRLKSNLMAQGKYSEERRRAVSEEVKQDIEGMQTMRTLARNMAFMLKCKEAGLKSGVEMPKTKETVETNFIR